MHELSLTESIVATVCEHVGDEPVRALALEIGALSGVVADAVRFCFELCAQGTPLEGARLDIAEIPGRARCRDCASLLELPDLIALCRCGSANLEITGGRQLKIKAVELGGV
jgi:hydrogenase nickel incorporation protein HypA/HybF